MQVLRAYHSLRRKVMVFCCGKEPRYSIAYTTRGAELDTWENTVPRGTFVFETVQRTIVDETETRTRIYYPGSIVPKNTDGPSFFEENADLPWMWIGGLDEYGDIHTLTSEMSQFILRGNRITYALLWAEHPEIVTWKYMCPLTFEELDFPTDGITI